MLEVQLLAARLANFFVDKAWSFHHDLLANIEAVLELEAP